MPATCEVYNGCPEEWLPYLRELLSLDMLCPVSTTFVRDQLGQLLFHVPPAPLHWSRQGEWPWVMNNIELRHEHRMLDAGSGWSTLKFALARRCHKIVALELDPEFIAKAQTSIDGMGYADKITQVQGDVRRMPFPDGWFDRVVCVSVVEHMPEGWVEAVRELVRVTRPGGRMLLTMDIRIRGTAEGNDFYLDPDGAAAVLHELQCPTPNTAGKRIIGSKQMDDKVEIVVVMIKYDKPL